MSRSLRRGILAAALVLAVAPLSACAAGKDAPTLEVRPDNASTTVGDIEIQNAVVIVAGGTGAPASVSAMVVNNGDKAQTLESVALDGGHPFALGGSTAGTGGSISVPAKGTVLLGGKNNASATLADFAKADSVTIGDFAKVTFQLSTTGEVSLLANVVEAGADSYYEPFAPTPPAQAPPAQAPAPQVPSTGTTEAPRPGGSKPPVPGASQSAGTTPGTPPSTTVSAVSDDD